MSTETHEGVLRAELKAEYSRLQDTYEDFDKRSLTIKGWISAAAVTGASLGLKDGKLPGNEVWIVVIVVLLSIWCVETYWKMFQYGFRDRIRILEAYFRNDKDSKGPPSLFQIYHSWNESHVHDTPIYRYEHKFRPLDIVLRFIKVMCYPFVFLSYLPLIILCLAFYLRISMQTVGIATLGALAIALLVHVLFVRPNLKKKASAQ